MNNEKSIYACYEEIRQREIRELKDAIRKSGSYKVTFGEDKAPIVMCNLGGYDPHPADVRIREVTLIDGSLSFYGEEKFVDGAATGFHGYCCIPCESIAYGHIDFVTSAIPRKELDLGKDAYALCETVAEFSHLLYDKLYERNHDTFAVMHEIYDISLAFEQKIADEGKYDNEDDYLLAIDKRAAEILAKLND